MDFSFEGWRRFVLLWGQGRWWFPRLLLVLYLGNLSLEMLQDSTAPTWFGPANLGIHETGHLVFRLTGHRFLEIAGGTITQLAAPLFLIVSFLRQGDPFAPMFGLFWLGTNLANISVYLADARARALPLVTVGFSKHIIHDWNFLLGQLGLLSWDAFLGTLTWAVAFLVMWCGCLYGLWICHLIAAANSPRKESP